MGLFQYCSLVADDNKFCVEDNPYSSVKMIIYKCAISGDELFTDAKKIEEDDHFYKVRGKNISRKDTIDDSLIGGNASAEEAAEGAEDAAVSGIDLVIDHRYNASGFGTKKEYQAYFKGYAKALLEKVAPADVKGFQTGLMEAFKVASGWFKDLDFYTSESMDENGLIVLNKWEPNEAGDDEPVFYYFKCGVVKEKY